MRIGDKSAAPELIDTELPWLKVANVSRGETIEYEAALKAAKDDQAQKEYLIFKHFLRGEDGAPFDDVNSAEDLKALDSKLVDRILKAATDAFAPDPKP